MEVPFKLPGPAYQEYTWVLQDEHAPASQTPLTATTRGLGGAPLSGDVPEAIVINGYNYRRSDVGLSFGRMTAPDTEEELTRWRREWLPPVELLADRLLDFDPAAVHAGGWQEVLDEQGGEYQRVFAGVHRSAVGPARMAVERFVSAYAQRFGESRRQDALALLQGFPNLSLERAAALWDLSRMLRANPRIRTALDRSLTLEEGTRGLEEFQERLTDVLSRFGYTTNNGMQDMSTWAEDPTIPLAMVRGYSVLEDESSPRKAAAKHRESRAQLEQELKAQVAVDPSVAALIPLMKMAQPFLPNLEDHNLLVDQRLNTASRYRWLTIGRHLTQQGGLASPDDVFYYERSELITALEGGDRVRPEAIAERRHLQSLYRAVQPPPTLGKLPEDPSAPLRTGHSFHSGMPVEAGGQMALRGTAASPGAYRGRARIVESLVEAKSLVRGDVLVCRSTTPPWSPYFGIVGAAVTNAGGVLSHGAIVAREFGLPAVVGVSNATAIIPEGATVTVDGTTGTVIVEA